MCQGELGRILGVRDTVPDVPWDGVWGQRSGRERSPFTLCHPHQVSPKARTGDNPSRGSGLGRVFPLSRLCWELSAWLKASPALCALKSKDEIPKILSLLPVLCSWLKTLFLEGMEQHQHLPPLVWSRGHPCHPPAVTPAGISIPCSSKIQKHSGFGVTLPLGLA